MFLSPTSSSHQSKIDIKVRKLQKSIILFFFNIFQIEREGDTATGEGQNYQVGKEHFFKVDIEKAFETKTDLNLESKSSNLVGKEIFVNPKDAAKYRFLYGNTEQEKQNGTKESSGFNEIKVKIDKNYEDTSVLNSNNVPLLDVVVDKLDKKFTDPTPNEGLILCHDLNDLMPENSPILYEDEKTKPNLNSHMVSL